MKVVQTMRGVIPRDQLSVAVLLHEVPDGLAVTAEWRLIAEGPNGEFVKRDTHTVVYADPGSQAQAVAQGIGMVVGIERDGVRGLVPRSLLQVSVVLDETANALVVATEWRIKSEGVDGRHVRRDVMGLMLATPEVQIAAAQLDHMPCDTAMVPAAPVSPDVTIGLTGQQVGVEQSKLS